MTLVTLAAISPLLIVGIGLMVAALFLPWLTAGVAADRRWRGGLALAGAVLVALGLLTEGGLSIPQDEVPPPPGGSRVGASGIAPGDGVLNKEQCAERLSSRMAELAGAAASPKTLPEADRAPRATGIGLVSGTRTGTYYAIADDLVMLAQRRNVPLFNRQTQGSLENVRLLADPQENAALGFAQSDVLAWLRRSSDPAERQMAASLRLVMPLYAEEVHVLARREIGSLAALAGRRIVTASGSGGSLYTAENLLRSRGIVPASLDGRDTAANALCKVITGEADAMVIVAGKPVGSLVSLDALKTLSGQPLARVHLLPIEDRSGEEGFEVAQLGPADYVWMERPVPTLAVRALLMAIDFSAQRSDYQRLRCQQLGRIGQLLRDELPGLREAPHHPKWRDVDPQRAVRGWKREGCAHV